MDAGVDFLAENLLGTLDGQRGDLLALDLAGTAWAIFHILIITLQAFVFMMLALVYLGQAHDAH